MKSDNIIIIFGRNAVKEALKNKRVISIYVQEGNNDKELLDLIKLQHLNPVFVNRKELDNKCQGVHQGVMAICKPYEYLDLNEVIRRASKVDVPIIICLDGINDPHNFGAIMRSADIFNVSGIVISKHNQVPLNATVAKTSAGAINFVPVSLVSNMSQALEKLKENGFWIVSTSGEASINYHELKYDFPIALVIGNEGDGVSRLVIKNSDYVVKIPQSGHIESLNASVATGILLARIRN